MEPRTLLVDFLRDAQGLTGTKVGCETGQCGACAVLIDDRSVKSCTVLAVQTDGSAVTTIEGVNGEVGGTGLNPLQQALWEEHATQCGFCTPGSPPSTPARSPAGGKLQQPDSPVFNKQLTEAQAREVLAATTA